MTPAALKELIAKTQRRFEAIDKADYAEALKQKRPVTPSNMLWKRAAKEVAPAEWAEIVRVLAQGESYYGGEY